MTALSSPEPTACTITPRVTPSLSHTAKASSIVNGRGVGELAEELLEEGPGPLAVLGLGPLGVDVGPGQPIVGGVVGLVTTARAERQ